MQLLKNINDQVTLHILCDLLESAGIGYRVENVGMNSLMPLPGLIEARVLVDDKDFETAQLILKDIEQDSQSV